MMIVVVVVVRRRGESITVIVLVVEPIDMYSTQREIEADERERKKIPRVNRPTNGQSLLISPPFVSREMSKEKNKIPRPRQ